MLLRKRWKWMLALLVLLGPLLYWLLAPLASPRFRIVDDEAKLAAKQAFLRAQTQRRLEQGAAPGRRPNIVLILADDLGKTDISMYGSRLIQTPHIDSIGQSGATFSEGYITSPICAPSRAGLMTGRYQQRFGFELIIHERYPRNRLEGLVFKHILARRGDWRVADELVAPEFDQILKQGLPPSEITIAELLKASGYSTAIMGKWHLGASAASIPTHRGFDYHYGFYGAQTLYARTDHPEIVNQHGDDFSDKFMWSRHGDNCVLRRNDQPVDEELYLTTKLAHESSQWILQHKNEPFFLYLPFSAPHTPFQATRKYFERFAHIAEPHKRVYLAMLAALDDSVGEVLQTLRDANLEQNTLVLFLSDNGGATYTHATDNAPLRGGKFTNFEGGINVPFMVQWKGQLPAGRRFAQPVSSLDIFPTLAAVAGAALPADRIYDGVNLLPLLSGNAAQPPALHPALYWRSLYTKAIRRGPYKLVRDDLANRTVLFDVEKDKSETTNLAAESPDLVSSLLRDLSSWEAGLQNPLWPRVMDYHHRDRDGIYYFPL